MFNPVSGRQRHTSNHKMAAPAAAHYHCTQKKTSKLQNKQNKNDNILKQTKKMAAPAVHINTVHKKNKEKQKHIHITKKNYDKVLKQTK